MANLTAKSFLYQYKANPSVETDNRTMKVKNLTFFSFDTPIATYLPAERVFLVLDEPPEHPKAAYIAHHLRDAHNVLTYALRVPFLLPALPTYAQIRAYHTERLVALQRQDAASRRLPVLAATPNADTLFTKPIAAHQDQLRLLDAYFPQAMLPQSLPGETEIAAAEAAGFISMPRATPPMKSTYQQRADTHDTYTAIVLKFFDFPHNDYFMRHKKLHKPTQETSLFYGRREIAAYSTQSKRFYVLADHNDPKILAILREIHTTADRKARQRTVYIPSFDTSSPEENWRIYNRHLIGIARFITHYERDCSGARDTAMRFRTIHKAATRYFHLTNAPELPFMPDDPAELAALRRYGAFREDKPENPDSA